MVKPPYTHLAYSIIAFVLFLTGIYDIFVRHTLQGWFGLFIFFLPLIVSIVLLIVFFVKKKEVKKTDTKSKR